jgi:hypothetical protein
MKESPEELEAYFEATIGPILGLENAQAKKST